MLVPRLQFTPVSLIEPTDYHLQSRHRLGSRAAIVGGGCRGRASSCRGGPYTHLVYRNLSHGRIHKEWKGSRGEFDCPSTHIAPDFVRLQGTFPVILGHEGGGIVRLFNAWLLEP